MQLAAKADFDYVAEAFESDVAAIVLDTGNVFSLLVDLTCELFLGHIQLLTGFLNLDADHHILNILIKCITLRSSWYTNMFIKNFIQSSDESVILLLFFHNTSFLNAAPFVFLFLESFASSYENR